jgi:hypothetical protein
VYSALSASKIKAEDISHVVIEKMVNEQKTHRNIVELDRVYLQNI